MNEQIDLSKGITRLVWNALVAKARDVYGHGCEFHSSGYRANWWTNEDTEGDEAKVAKLLNISQNTTNRWHFHCDKTYPVHCRSNYGKVIANVLNLYANKKTIKGSIEYRAKLSSVLKNHWQKRRELKNQNQPAKSISIPIQVVPYTTTSVPKTDAVDLFDASYWSTICVHDLSVIKQLIDKTINDKSATAKKKIEEMAYEAGLTVTIK